ncbi:PA2928 family protein [Dyadobacter psychrotolerans]|uniref:Uncharacterized protein n=1 Tax=Dyadobacter psychrotolerans TaxID=2541721 RepID=A0A4R5DES3_9BACT|nr:PA2928 family protein [Dyadobacter psychrotolerans]TDE11637.1 hypothetical protein E0F88_24745 [Dyadobacter psychrotolerans]
MKRNGFLRALIIFTAIIGLIITFIVFLPEQVRQVYPPRLYGPLARVDAGGRKMFFYLTVEEKVRSKFTSRRSNTFTEYFSVYRLCVRDAESGRLIKSEIISEIKSAIQESEPKILGPVKNGLWIWNSGPKLYDPVSLTVTTDLETIKKQNPEIAGVLPKEIAFFKVSEPNAALVIKSLDARYFQVDELTAKITDAEKILEGITWRKTAEDGFTYTKQPGVYAYYNYIYGNLINSFLAGKGIWHGLLSKRQREQLFKWPGAPGQPDKDGQNRYYQVRYKLDDRQEIELDISTAKQTGDKSFLQGGFIKRKEQMVWDVPNPSSTLVMSKDILGRDGKFVIHRLGRDGKIIWSQSSDLSELDQVADGDNYIVLAGFKDQLEPTRNRVGILVWIDQNTGKKDEFSVSEDL